MDTDKIKIPSRVLRPYFGIPTLFKVIGYDKETDQFSTQFDGNFGISWIKRSEVIKEIFDNENIQGK